eukprot:TRINITY_DN8101_c0_g1_i1.p1 TRINITY_DN8101_c0_g1~~TRINITY_DN8101_c0_g1_i1.p1  ORF type:complete len:101 (-),score=8.19 TRINITY_DN8101_c0_g1_i1:54-356(-)
MSEEFRKHADLSDIVGNEVCSPSEKLFLHGLEFFFQQSSISYTHLVSSSFDGNHVELSAVIIESEFFTIGNSGDKLRLLFSKSELTLVASATLDSVSWKR